MVENYLFLLILTQGGDTRPIIVWTGQEPGGHIDPDQTLEPAMTHLSVPPDSNGITK